MNETILSKILKYLSKSKCINPLYHVSVYKVMVTTLFLLLLFSLSCIQDI